MKYEEEFHIDTADNTVRWLIFLNGQQIKDFGVNKVGVESDNIYDDGRPIKVGLDQRMPCYNVCVLLHLILVIIHLIISGCECDCGLILMHVCFVIIRIPHHFMRYFITSRH